MPLEYYLKAIEELQKQIRDLDQPIDLKIVCAYANLVLQAKKEHPEHFSNWQVGEILSSKGLGLKRPVGILLSHSASPFK